MILDWSKRRGPATGLGAGWAPIWGGQPLFQSTRLRLSWNVLGQAAEVRLRLAWNVLGHEVGGQPSRPTLHLAWTVGTPPPTLHLTWLVISANLSVAHASASRKPVAVVRLEMP